MIDMIDHPKCFWEKNRRFGVPRTSRPTYQRSSARWHKHERKNCPLASAAHAHTRTLLSARRIQRASIPTWSAHGRTGQDCCKGAGAGLCNCSGDSDGLRRQLVYGCFPAQDDLFGWPAPRIPSATPNRHDFRDGRLAAVCGVRAALFRMRRLVGTSCLSRPAQLPSDTHDSV
jgi:hypothetical protein